MKHLVSFDEAQTVFFDFLPITITDPIHSINEHRFITIGLSSKNRLLIVANTEDNETIRIISSRSAAKEERK
ncbi:MAG: BrnT family toxin [Candidatus Kapabacteria bacterium]|nr:BrnT family toxin [Candidatus Kapabacteria bacterium]